MFKNPQATEHMKTISAKTISAIASRDAHLYEVSEVYGR
jgi:hypothetical protein